MGAFDKVKSGIPSMDEALDYIRLGDNVVLQVSSMDEFRYFVEPYVRQAIVDERNLIYFRFAGHEPLLKENEAKWYRMDPGEGFEQFTIKVHRIIEREGRDAFYVFDCLSELQEAWAADLMMGNFFRVTCPFLFQLDTVAMFPLLRGDEYVIVVTDKAAAKTTSSAGKYRVTSGNTLSSIASRHGVSLQALLKANPQIKDANKIFVGDLLVIPGR